MIVNNRVVGTRITVWDVLHYLDAGWSAPEIAATLHLSDTQVAAMVQYITEHREALDVVHRQIEARKAQQDAAALEAAKAVTFRQAADMYIESHRAGWRNRRSRLSTNWRSTATASPAGRSRRRPCRASSPSRGRALTRAASRG